MADVILSPPRTNTLALIFQEVLTVVVRVRSGRQQVQDAEAFRNQIREKIRAAEQEARRHGFNDTEARMGILAAVAFLDETVLNAANPAFRDWPRLPLQEELFGHHVAGESFFQYINQLLAGEDSEKAGDLVEIFLICLLLGYRGRYSAGRAGDLKVIQDRMVEKLYRIRGYSHTIATIGDLPEDSPPPLTDPWSRRLLFAAAGFGLLAIFMLLMYKLMLGSSVANLRPLAVLLGGAGV